MAEPKEPRSHGEDKVLLSVVVASYSLVATGVALIIFGAMTKSGIARSITEAFGSTIAAAFLLSIFYEHFAHELLMREFSNRVRAVVQEERANLRVRASGIVDISLGDYRNDIIPMFACAEAEIWICKTWIPPGDVECVKAGLEQALSGNRRIAVKILCLDPASPLAAQRSRDMKLGADEGAGDKQGSKRVAEGLDQIMGFCKEKRLYQHVEVKVYGNLPALSLYANDDTALIGWYWMGNEAFDGPVLEVKGKEETGRSAGKEEHVLSARARKNFRKMWEGASDYAREVDPHLILDKTIICPLNLHEQLATKKGPAELKTMLEQWPELKEYGQQIIRFIKKEGYCIVKSFPFKGYDPVAQKNLFLMLVIACGTPSDHIPGKEEYICKVTPRKDLNRQIATYSEHDHEAPLHTDSHYRDDPEQFVAFLMEKQADFGGRNILLKSSWILNEMKATEEGRRWLNYLKANELPSAMPSRYSEHADEVPRPFKAPIINQSETIIRFREDTIREGIRLAGQRNREEEEALDFFSKLVYRSPERRGVTLANGEILFINNHTVLHARTAFEGFSRVLLRIRFNAYPRAGD